VFYRIPSMTVGFHWQKWNLDSNGGDAVTPGTNHFPDGNALGVTSPSVIPSAHRIASKYM
jgi:hypothetical protein